MDDIAEAYELFAAQRDGVMKVAILPGMARAGRQLAHAAIDTEC